MGIDSDLPKLVEEHSIAKGVRCLLYRTTENPTVAVHGSLRAGTALESKNHRGIAELATRLLIRGSRKIGPEKIADSLESVGATISFRNAPEAILFQARMTTPWMKRVLDILSECLTSPSFDRKDVEREKEELLTDIRLRDDDPTRRGMRELLALVYPKNHPYSQDRFGTAESVKKIERATLVDFFHDHSLIDEPDVQEETDRYMAGPAQALGYKIGELEILKLRAYAKDELGDRFDLRAFHDQVLTGGALPLDLLSDRIHDFVAQQKASLATSGHGRVAK